MEPNFQPEGHNPKTSFLTTETNRLLLVLNVAMAIVYFAALLLWFPRGNSVLFWALMAGELFHLWMIFTYCYSVWNMDYEPPFDLAFKPGVDVMITVCGEPVDIVEHTARAALAMRYPNFTVNILNDGFVAKKDNWRDIEAMAKRLGVRCITRRVPGGAKSGNINNAVLKTKNPYIAVFDADHIPHEDFLEKMMGYFRDPKMGFVQSPQYYKNFEQNYVTGGAWEQQELFFGAICKGKNRLNSTFMCGTNMVLSRKALEAAGGMCETNIAEDFLTSLFIHEKGYKSVYVPEVLAEGLAPEDFLSYTKQQFRWARGSLEVVFRYNPLFRRGLTWAQKIQYLASASFYLSSIFVVVDALLPLAFFYFGQVPFITSTMALALVFLPYIFLTVYVLQLTSNYSYSYRALAFSMSSFTIHMKALWAVLTGAKSGFNVTSKRQVKGNFLYLTAPHLFYVLLAATGVGVAIHREGLSASVLTNSSWAFFNIGMFLPFVIASSPLSETQEAPLPANQPAAVAPAGPAVTDITPVKYSELPSVPSPKK